MVGCADRSRAFTFMLKGRCDTNHYALRLFHSPFQESFFIMRLKPGSRRVSKEVLRQARRVWNHSLWAHMTQQTWEALKKQVVAMVTRHRSVTGLRGHNNVSFSWATVKECQ